MMIDENLARIRSTVNNIRRYRRLLETQLTEIEREFIQKTYVRRESGTQQPSR